MNILDSVCWIALPCLPTVAMNYVILTKIASIVVIVIQWAVEMEFVRTQNILESAQIVFLVRAEIYPAI